MRHARSLPSRPATNRLLAITLLASAALTACGGEDDGGGSVWPGLSSNLDCGNLDTGVPATLEIEIDGETRTLDAHVAGATEDSVMIRVVCQNPKNPSEALAAVVSAEIWNDLEARRYEPGTPSADADDAEAGELELRSVSAYLQFSPAGQSLDRIKTWAGRYETDSGLPATDETRDELGWTDDVAFTVESATELPDDEQDSGVGTSYLRWEIHGSVELEQLAAVNATQDQPDPARDPIRMRALF